MSDKFFTEFCDSFGNVMPLGNKVLDIFQSKSLKLYYGVVNIFDLLKIDSESRALFVRDFIRDFESNINSPIPDTSRAALGVKMLADQLVLTPVAAPACLYYENNRFRITKGGKKLIALMLINLPMHPVIVTSFDDLKDFKGFNQINDDDELYNLLRKHDPTAQTFYAQLIKETETSMSFHYLVNIQKATTWLDKNQCKQDYIKFSGITKRKNNIVLLNNAYSTDKNLACLKNNKRIEFFGDIDRIHLMMKNSDPNYLCTVYSKNKFDVTVKYLNFISSNLFMRQATQFGYTHDLSDFNSNEIVVRFSQEGCTSQIPFIG